MFELAILAIALGGLAAICMFGSRYIAADDARRRVQIDDTQPGGWLPTRRDRAILRHTERQVLAALTVD